VCVFALTTFSTKTEHVKKQSSNDRNSIIFVITTKTIQVRIIVKLWKCSPESADSSKACSKPRAFNRKIWCAGFPNSHVTIVVVHFRLAKVAFTYSWLFSVREAWFVSTCRLFLRRLACHAQIGRADLMSLSLVEFLFCQRTDPRPPSDF